MKEEERQRCLEMMNETLRRLGPYRQASGSEPFRVNDAQLAQLLTEVVLVLHFVLSDVRGEKA
jgi:hypothetical protein